MDLRNDKAKARDKWFQSREGVACQDGSAHGQWLKNRLEHAFCDGWDAALKSVEGQKPPTNTGSPKCLCKTCFICGSCGVTIFPGTILVLCPKYDGIAATSGECLRALRAIAGYEY